MKPTVVIVSMLICSALSAQNNATSFKFDFGPGKAQPGYVQVLPSARYSNESGYGFSGNAVIKGVDRGGSDALKGDYCTSDQPFFFSVKLPEGNYNVSVTTGDKNETSVTTIKAECRRLMAEKIQTAKGEFKTTDFTVHIRDTLIRTTGKTVRIKPREINYLHWDDKLTLEFNNSSPKICGVVITPAKEVTTLFLAGNSTIVDQAEEPWAAWGQMIPVFFKPGKVAIANYAESGESLSSFISERRLEKVFSLMKPGDYLFIEFGHNDQKQRGAGIGAFTSFKKDLKTTIGEVRRRGGIPVLVTAMNRRSFDSTGKINHTLGDYPEAMRQTAKEEGIALIDLNAMSKILYETWGPEKSIKAFVHYPANTFPGQDRALSDNTHFSTYGAYEIAKCIVTGIRSNKMPLIKYLLTDLPVFDPSQPAAFAEWKLPASPLAVTAKPDGN